MLVLTRKVGETVLVGTDISVTVLGITGAQVRIGFNAPKGVVIDRLETAEAKAKDGAIKDLRSS